MEATLKAYKSNKYIKRTSLLKPSRSNPVARIAEAEAVLHHMARQNGREVFIAKIMLSKHKPVTIGRSSTCTYILSESIVSGHHCKLHVVPSSDGGVIVCCKDLSSNGVLLNGQKMKNTSMIVMDGDVLEIPSLTGHKFVCHHIRKQLDEDARASPSLASLKAVGPYLVSSHCLGSGSYASVHLACDPKSHKQIACKIIRMKRESEYTSLLKEVRILQFLDHPNINKVLWRERVGRSLHIFLQLCTAGDLFTYITTQPDYHLLEGEAKYIMYQILKGLRYLHDKKISHRDLKPENLLLSTPGPYPFIQIADFGLARPKSYQETLNVAGTVSYLPPEGIMALDNKEMGYLGMPSDCWSSGVILFIMLSGRHPFDNAPSCESSTGWLAHSYEPDCEEEPSSQLSVRSEYRIKRRIVTLDFCFDEDWWGKMRNAQELITSLLSSDPRQRATVAKAMQSRWLTQEYHELEREYRTSILDGHHRR